MAETPGTSRLPTLPLDDIPRSIKIIDRWIRDTVSPYVTYTPVLTGTSGGFAYGAGAYQLGRFKRAGSRCNVEIIFNFGGAGFNPGGNTTWSISLPVLPILASLPTAWNNKLLGEVYFGNGLTTAMYAARAHRVGPGGAVLRDFVIGVTGGGPNPLLTGTVPGMGANSFMEVNLSYECAS